MAKIAPKTVIPKVAQTDKGLPLCVHVQPTAAFTIVHHHSWTFTKDPSVPGYEDGVWLPDTGTIRHEPGGNGVTKNGNPQAAILGAQTKGSIPILNGDTRLGKFALYLASYDIKGSPLKLHCLAGVRYALIRGGKAAVPTPDKAWMYAFRTKIHSSGIIPDMPEEYLGERIHALKSRLSLYAKQASAGKISEESYQRKFRECEATITEWEAAFEKQFGDETTGDGSVIVAPDTMAPDPTLVAAVAAEPEAPVPTPRKRVSRKTGA